MSRNQNQLKKKTSLRNKTTGLRDQIKNADSPLKLAQNSAKKSQS